MTWNELRKNPKRAKFVVDLVKALGSIKYRTYEKLIANYDHNLDIELCDFLEASGKKVVCEESGVTHPCRSPSQSRRPWLITSTTISQLLGSSANVGIDSDLDSIFCKNFLDFLKKAWT